MFFGSLVLFLFATSIAALPSPHGSSHHGAQLARRVLTLNETTTQLSKRFEFSGTRWTFFAPGLGACGKTNGDNDFIVALNIEQWDGGSHCFEKIQMSFGGKTTTATIVDECPGCPYGGLDLSPGLFSFFASEDLGVISGNWDFGSSGSGSGSSQPSSKAAAAPKPTTTHSTTHTTPTPTPTSTSHATPTSTTASSTSSSVSSSATSSSAPSTSSTASTSSAAPAVPSSNLYNVVQGDTNDNGTLAKIYLALVQLGSLVEDA